MAIGDGNMKNNNDGLPNQITQPAVVALTNAMMRPFTGLDGANQPGGGSAPFLVPPEVARQGGAPRK
jgi:hypothetical protein